MAITPEQAKELVSDLESDYSKQRSENSRMSELFQRRQPAETGQKDPVKRITTGFAALTIMQSYSLLTQPPFSHIKSPSSKNDKDAENVESALAGWGSRYYTKVWLPGVYDFVWGGYAFWCVYPDKNMWSANKGFNQYKGEPEAEYNKRVKMMKEDITPIRMKYGDIRTTRPTFDEDDELDQVIEILEMRARAVREAYPKAKLRDGIKDKDLIKVWRYADKYCTQTFINDKDVQQVYEYEHKMGVNPFVYARAPLQAPLEPGMLGHGAIYHTKDLMDMMDELISDVNFNVKETIKAETVVKASPDRPAGATGAPAVDIERKPFGHIDLWQDESIERLQAPQTNVDVFRLYQLARELVQTVAIQPVLLGLLGSDQSGVLYNTAAQYAQRQYGPATAALEGAVKDIGKRFCRAVQSIGEPVPIYSVVGDEEMRVTITPNQARTWENRIQSSITLAIANNENATAEIARLLTDPSNPLMSKATAMTRYINIANPVEELDRVSEDQIERGLAPLFLQMAQQALQDELNDPGPGFEERYTNLDPFAQKAFAAYVGGGQNGNGGGQMARSAANTVREGNPTQPYQVQSA